MTTVDQAALAAARRHAGPLALAWSPSSRLWLQTTLLLLVVAIPTLLAFAVDERELNGISVWSKPLKFQLSVVVYLGTLALVAGLLSERARRGWLLRVTAWLSATVGILEIAYITGQAGRGRHSHFNTETVFEATMFSAMGVGAVLLIAASAVVGVLLLRAARPEVGPGLRLGGGLGLIAGSLLTFVVAGYLGGNGGHWVGGEASDATGMALTGWSTTGGDLRVSHFLATHMMQGLPLIGLAADRLGRNGQRTVLVAGALWIAAVAATFVQALIGQPLL